MTHSRAGARDLGNPTILLVEDDEDLLLAQHRLLARRSDARLLSCRNARDARERLATTPIDLVLLDLGLPDQRGELLLQHVLAHHPHVRVVVTGDDSVATAIQCMKLGAFDYLTKPFAEGRLCEVVAEALGPREAEIPAAQSEEDAPSAPSPKAEHFARVLTVDPGMHALFRHVERIAGGSHPVFVSGETGTGKELIARALHGCSERPGCFVSVNVAGLDDAMFSDVLFGHRRGAFTGAHGPRRGLMEAAEEGTLFFDEIGDLCEASQVKLLRVLQEREYYPHGSDEPLPLRARIVAATHKDPSRLRPDFYFRLRSYCVELPPLRERLGDLPLLVEHMVALAAEDLGKRTPFVPAELFIHLRHYDFPGNVRELQSMVFDAVARHDEGVLHLDSFLEHVRAHARGPLPANSDGRRMHFPAALPTLREIEDAAVQEALERTGGNRSAAARMLGVSRPTLQRRLRS